MPEEVVNIPISLFESSKGQYFVGQSGLLSFGNGQNAWCGLFNPCNSHVNLFVNVFTITNIAATDFIAEFWFNPTNLTGKESVSDLVTPSNLAICPRPQTKIELIFADKVHGVPSGGINAFDRLIPARTTIVEEEDGKYIIPPGEAFAIVLIGQANTIIQARVAFGFWQACC